jgi:hypothetical protein
MDIADQPAEAQSPELGDGRSPCCRLTLAKQFLLMEAMTPMTSHEQPTPASARYMIRINGHLGAMLRLDVTVGL